MQICLKGSNKMDEFRPPRPNELDNATFMSKVPCRVKEHVSVLKCFEYSV